MDLCWRLADLGYNGWYAPGIVVHHPASDPARHTLYLRLVARNRVWIAYRRLPAVLIPVYLTVWVLITVARTRDRKALATWASGFHQGLRGGHGERRPMSWRTAWRLTRAGRPPIV
ncbi:hypothetical protein GCM10010495_73070 [Kitasatospora herbaricolor]|uniref:glycosyltransferase family 2 protein n=1 Tax=Kitasatospora herbaricolor TaxID=68217 RepID=UPI00174879DF|nr:hypothetical protein [Kitasatospora herbaricolor]MDQ0306792.1 GT2 family glycosyltransferase [Kitasatospora herbaricolor]GGV44947.1 hypothetical protein GCM10010495_73070 [Kitasatospora herbaricolor]